MSVRLAGDGILLEADCTVEDAELLLALLLDHPAAPVELGGCGRIHTAVAQLLLAARRPVLGVPANGFAREWLLPQLLSAAD